MLHLTLINSKTKQKKKYMWWILLFIQYLVCLVLAPTVNINIVWDNINLVKILSVIEIGIFVVHFIKGFLNSTCIRSITSHNVDAVSGSTDWNLWEYNCDCHWWLWDPLVWYPHLLLQGTQGSKLYWSIFKLEIQTSAPSTKSLNP